MKVDDTSQKLDVELIKSFCDCGLGTKSPVCQICQAQYYLHTRSTPAYPQHTAFQLHLVK
jgi:hypothetical protein